MKLLMIEDIQKLNKVKHKTIINKLNNSVMFVDFI